MTVRLKVESKQFAVTKRKELETTYAREVFQCKLKKRVVVQ